jgi:sigma-B regulation protein RsbU (phosphoserine phosphatase)
MTQILIVGSDQVSRQTLAAVLSAEGYEGIWVEDGAAAIAALGQTQPAMVICDWQLAGSVSGIALCQHVHHHPRLSATLCLMLAPRQSSAKRINALEMGADDLLMKPLDPAELKARLRAGMRMWQLTRDLQTQKQLLEAELSEAEAYVRSLLPQDSLDHRVPIQSRFIPSRLLGGDCFDYYWLDPDYLAVYLLDVSGHGLGSALLSTSVLNVLRSQSLPNVNFYRPEKVLRALNETFPMTDQNEKYFTIWYGVYNRANRQLLYASAGHPPAILVSRTGASNTVERLRTPGMPVGMLPEANYGWQRCHVPPNSRLYLFSDGIYEIIQTDETLLGLDAFVDILAESAAHPSIDEILAAVTHRNAQDSFADDLSLLEVELN